MPGGNKNIKPEDNPKPFQEGNKLAEEWTEKDAVELGEQLIDWLYEHEDNIFFKGFILMERRIGQNTISYLSGKFSTFNDLIKLAKEIQEFKLNNRGVKDELNAQMTKFCLINHHGYKERSVIEKQVEKIPLTEKEREDRIKELIKKAKEG